MSATLSIVIPTLNAAQDLPDCIEALYQGLGEGLIHELILSDGGSQDETRTVAEALGARLITGSPGRGGQLARGVGAARGDWVLVLHADTRLQPGWVAAVTRHMSQSPDRAGWFSLKFDAPGGAARLVAGWANLRSALFGLPYGDQGLLISRTLYDHVGGYPDIPLMEDVAMARALRGRLTRLDGVAVTSARKYEAEGWLARGARNLSTLALYFAGVTPERLVSRYRGPKN